MKDYLTNFVQEYKAILTMKEAHKDDQNRVKLALNTLSLTFIMLVIAYVTSLLFKTSENLNYLFLMLNVIVLGSFIIFKLIKELRFKANNKLSYNVMSVIVIESLPLITTAFFTISLILVTIFINHVSYFTFMYHVFLMVLCLITYELVRSKVSKFSTYESLWQIIKGSIYLYLLFVSLTYTVQIENVVTNLLVVTPIICIVYFYKVITFDNLLPVYKNRIYLVIGVLVTVVLFYKYEEYIERDQRTFLTPGYDLQLIETDVDYTKDPNVNSFEDEIVINRGDSVEFYNSNLELVRVINDQYFKRYVFHPDKLLFQDVIQKSSYEQDEYSDIYEYHNETFIKTDTIETLPNQPSYYTDEGYFTPSYWRITDSNSETEWITSRGFENSSILIQTDRYAIFRDQTHQYHVTNNGSFVHSIKKSYHILYSNGMVVFKHIENDDALYLSSLNDFINGNSDNYVTLSESIQGVPEYFFYEENTILVNMNDDINDPHSSNTMYHYDRDFERIGIVESTNILFVNENILISTIDAKELTYVDMENLYKLEYNFEEPLYNSAFTILSFTLIFTAMPLPLLKRGELDV